MDDDYGNTPMERVLSTLCEAGMAGLTLDEVIGLAWNAESTDAFMEAISLYSMHDIDVTGFAPMIVLD